MNVTDLRPGQRLVAEETYDGNLLDSYPVVFVTATEHEAWFLRQSAINGPWRNMATLRHDGRLSWGGNEITLRVEQTITLNELAEQIDPDNVPLATAFIVHRLTGQHGLIPSDSLPIGEDTAEAIANAWLDTTHA